MTEIILLITVAALLIIATATLVWLVLNVAGLLYTAVPYVPVPEHVADEVARTVRKHARGEHIVFYDIGSGDGRVVYAVGEQFPEGTAVGVEIAPFAYLSSLAHPRRRRAPNARTLFQDARTVSYANATHIFMYLLPKTVAAMYQRIRPELSPGTVIMCCDFPLKNVEPTAVYPIEKKGKKTYTFFVYVL